MASLIVVGLDLLIISIFWLSLICIKPLVGYTEDEINSNNLVGPDFTLMLQNQDHSNSIEDLNSI